MEPRTYTAQTFDKVPFSSIISAPDGQILSFLTHTRVHRAKNGILEFPLHGQQVTVENDAQYGYWTLYKLGDVRVRAVKDKWWRRNFDITFGKVRYVLAPVAAGRRDFVVKRVSPALEMMGRHIAGDVVGRLNLVDKELFRYELQFDGNLDLTLPAFCLWLVMMTNWSMPRAFGT